MHASCIERLLFQRRKLNPLLTVIPRKIYTREIYHLHGSACFYKFLVLELSVCVYKYTYFSIQNHNCITTKTPWWWFGNNRRIVVVWSSVSLNLFVNRRGEAKETLYCTVALYPIHTLHSVLYHVLTRYLLVQCAVFMIRSQICPDI